MWEAGDPLPLTEAPGADAERPIVWEHLQQRRNVGSGGGSSSQENNLDPDGVLPLGLRLTQSPSFVELIQTKLTQGSSSKRRRDPDQDGVRRLRSREKSPAGQAAEKLKASNFPVLLLKIGAWEWVSRHEGDVVAKFYYAKRKLVWEILEAGLKNKIEIQWSDVVGIRATHNNAQSILEIAVAKIPSFSKESDPMPRKHTAWTSSLDFTSGEASRHRTHFLQVGQGLLGRHFEKLIQCDLRLCLLSKQPAIVLDSPYFEPKPSVFDSCELGKKKNEFGSPIFFSRDDSTSPCTDQFSSESETMDMVTAPNVSSQGYLSPTVKSFAMAEIDLPSVYRRNINTSYGLGETYKTNALTQSEQHISNQNTTSNLTLEGTANAGNANIDVMEAIKQFMLNDNITLAPTACDDELLVSEIESFSRLIREDPAAASIAQSQRLQGDDKDGAYGSKLDGGADSKNCSMPNEVSTLLDVDSDIFEFMQPQAIPNNECEEIPFGHLPRVASLSHFLDIYNQ